MNFVIVTNEELKSEIISALEEFEEKRAKNEPPKLFTINQVAKKLGKAHSTIKRRVKQGYFKTTKDGLIPETAIEDYLNQK